MLSKLRDYSSYFLWFVVVTFVGFMAFSGVQECGSSPAQRGIVAEVNGQPISLQAFSLAVSRATQNRQQQAPDRELTDEQLAQIREQAWSQMLGALLLEQEADRRNIYVTDAELAGFLQRYPPQDLQQSAVFQTEGQFDYNKYLAAMSNTSPEFTQFWRSIESYWRPQLRQSKLQQQVISSVRVSDAELVEYFKRRKDQVRLEFLLLNAASYNSEVGTPDDSQLRELFEMEKPRYQRDERVVFEVAIWTPTPSAADSAWVETEIGNLKRQLDEGADFAELASDYTMDPSGVNTGGDLGWFGQGRMVAPFEEAAFALEVGQVSEPVKTQFGWHIIKVEDRRPAEDDPDATELRARHILLRPEVSQGTVDSIFDAAQIFAERVREGDAEFTEEVVKALGATYNQPRSLQRNESVPLLGSASDLKAWLFNVSPGSSSDVIEDGGKYVVARLIERREAGTADFEEVRSQVQARWITRSARERARPQAESLLVAAKSGEPMSQLAEAENVSLLTTGLITREDNVPQLGRTPIFMGSVFALEESDPWSDLIETERGWVVAHLLEKQRADTTEIAGVRDSVAGELLQSKQNSAFTAWYTQLYEEADIKDYRAQMFGS